MTATREKLLNPNRDSDLKVEVFTLGFSHSIILGRPEKFLLPQSPDVNFRPQEVTTNAFLAGMFFIESIQVANVNCAMGSAQDAYNWRNRKVDWPTLSPANRMVMSVRYTGKEPPKFRLRAALQRQFELEQQIKLLRLEIRDAMSSSRLKRVRSLLTEILERKDQRTFPGPYGIDSFDFSVTVSGPASITGYGA